MDFVVGLPLGKGKSVIMVVDRQSKYAHFIALSHPYTAASIAQEFVLNIFKLHGMPKTIVSDRDYVFLSTFWREFFKLHGSKLCMSSGYHPHSDGQNEVVNRCLKTYLRSTLAINLENGYSGFHGLNGAIIPLFIPLHNLTLLRLFIPLHTYQLMS